MEGPPSAACFLMSMRTYVQHNVHGTVFTQCTVQRYAQYLHRKECPFPYNCSLTQTVVFPLDGTAPARFDPARAASWRRVVPVPCRLVENDHWRSLSYDIWEPLNSFPQDNIIFLLPPRGFFVLSIRGLFFIHWALRELFLGSIISSRLTYSRRGLKR